MLGKLSQGVDSQVQKALWSARQPALSPRSPGTVTAAASTGKICRIACDDSQIMDQIAP